MILQEEAAWAPPHAPMWGSEKLFLALSLLPLDFFPPSARSLCRIGWYSLVSFKVQVETSTDSLHLTKGCAKTNKPYSIFRKLYPSKFLHWRPNHHVTVWGDGDFMKIKCNPKSGVLELLLHGTSKNNQMMLPCCYIFNKMKTLKT